MRFSVNRPLNISMKIVMIIYMVDVTDMPTRYGMLDGKVITPSSLNQVVKKDPAPTIIANKRLDL